MTAASPSKLTQAVAGYDKDKNVLRGADLDLEAGTITGLLGRNGAGKTTLMRTMLGLMNVSEGEAELFGESAFNASPETRRRVGYVAQDTNTLGLRTPREALNARANLYGKQWNRDATKARMDALGLQIAELDGLSVGQKQKFDILLALGHDPDLLVLDEPVASLDPAARRTFMQDIVTQNLDTGQTVLLSSHITSDLERICSHIAILHRGRIICHEPLDELKDTVRCLVFDGEPPGDLEVLATDGTRVWTRDPRPDIPNLQQELAFVLEDFFLAATAEGAE